MQQRRLTIRRFVGVVGLLAAALIVLPGCRWNRPESQLVCDTDLEHFKAVSTKIEFPDVESDNFGEIASTLAPSTIENPSHPEFWNLSLHAAIHLALEKSEVLRDLGGLVLQSPDSVQTIHGPAIQETDPRFGVPAALSAFDAAWSTEAFFEKNDRALNNQFFGGGTRILKQDLLAYKSEIFKRTATGTEFTSRHNVQYDFNNSPGNNTPNLPWATNFEMEVRQPFLQGAGADFNRIAGPTAVPGVYNGVLIARVNTDISLADFELGVRNLINDVETAYWELYYAYRELDAKIAARDRALGTWRKIYALSVDGLRGGEAEKEAQAREQYFRLEEEVQNALAGNIQERSRATTFRGTGGIYNNERRLRLMIGVPINDGRLIRPCGEPTMAKVMFNWEEVLVEGLTRRTELRRQKWQIKRRELEVIAARNFLYPSLDAVGRYRWRGLGHRLVEPNGTGRPPFNDAVQNLFDGDFQEWQLGFELAFPVGFRQAHAAVQNAKLSLARQHAILREQEREVAHDLSNSVAEKDRAYRVAQTNLNRREAAKDQLAALEARYDSADEREQSRLLDLLLDAQRRLADAEARYYRSLVEYMLAIKRIHYNKGSLLDYNEIYLAEGPWPGKAYEDAEKRDRLRLKFLRLDNFIKQRSPIVSQGEYPQLLHPASNADHAEPYDVPPESNFEPVPAPPSTESRQVAPGSSREVLPPPSKLQGNQAKQPNQQSAQVGDRKRSSSPSQELRPDNPSFPSVQSRSDERLRNPHFDAIRDGIRRAANGGRRIVGQLPNSANTEP